jgi:hypothetical protein
MMLNPKKCVFGISSEKLLGYMVSSQVIARLYGIIPGNRCKPNNGGGHRIIATTSDQKRNIEAGRHDGDTQLIHI